MRRLEHIVAPGEQVHLVTREHGVVLVRPFFRALGFVGLFGGAAYELAGSPAPATLRWATAVVALAVVAVSAVGFGRTVARWYQRRLVVSDRRALLLSGTMSRRTATIPLAALGDLEIDVPGWGKPLHYGSVVVSADGKRGPLFGLERLPDPDLLMALLLGLGAPMPRPRRMAAPLGLRRRRISA